MRISDLSGAIQRRLSLILGDPTRADPTVFPQLAIPSSESALSLCDDIG